MSKPHKGKPQKPLTYELAVARLPKVQSKREALLAVFQQTHADYHAAHQHLVSSFKAFTVASDDMARHQAIIDHLQQVIDRGVSAPAPEEKIVDAPLMTDAEFLHQKEVNPDIENIGKSKALFSMDQFIGGFSRYPNRKPYHEMAAARFLSLYELGKIGGAKATDYSQPYVDRSGPSQDGVLIAGESARRDYKAMKDAIGADAEKLLERVIVGRVSARVIASQRTGKAPDKVHGKAVAVVAQEVWDAIDAVAIHFKFKSVGNKRAA